MRPLLACNAPANLNSLPYPLLASVKLDGIRCIIKDGVALSRTLKPIRNRYIQSLLGQPGLNDLDGELIVGDPNASDCMRKTNSGVMSFEGEPDFTYYVFDIWNRPGVQYKEAYLALTGRMWDINKPYVQPLSQRKCNNTAEVEAHELSALDDGYEGLILRRPDGAYKYGRSTVKQGYLFKLKRFIQSEAIIIGAEPLECNTNTPELDALGYTKRSSAKAGMVTMPLLGAWVVKGPFREFNNCIFNVGGGLTLAERDKFWQLYQQNPNNFLGKIITYKFFPVGCKDKPRHAIFISFRDPDDLSARVEFLTALPIS